MNEFWHHYQEILSDPAHLAVEVTLMILVDGLLLGLAWPLLKRAVKRHDRNVHGAGRDEITKAGRQIRAVAASGNEVMKPWGFVPCGREHIPGRVCIWPEGHPESENLRGLY